MNQGGSIQILTKIFQKKEYLEDFLDGNLYINCLGYFQDIESKNLTETQADTLEGVVAQFQPKDFQLTISVPEIGISHTIPTEDYAAPSYLKSPYLFNLKCLCFYAPVIKLADLDTVKEQLTISKKMEEDFGSLLALFHNPQEFLNRVKDAVIANKYGYKSRRVSYFSPMDNFQANDDSMGFDKLDKFSFQKEFRILIETQEHEPTPLRLRIGSIRDICVPMTVDKFNKDMKIDINCP